MNKTALPPLESLAQALKNKNGHLVHVEITSIVNDSVLSCYKAISTITGALLTEFNGKYEMKSGIDGNSVFDGRGIILNLGQYSQFFIDESAKIKGDHSNPKNTIVEIKDIRSSMHIRLQIFNKKMEVLKQC